jgi:hypothetical protein
MNSKSFINIPSNRYVSLKDYKARYEHRILPQISKQSSNNFFDSNSKINNLLESKEDFGRNHHITSKSFNFRKSDNMTKDLEAKTLLNFYNFNGRNDNFSNEDYSSKELYNKLKQYSGLKHEEKQNISRNMKSFDTVYTKKQHSKGITMQSFVHDKEIYGNPFKSLSQIKLNKNIYSNVVNIYTNKLQDSYVNILSKVFLYINYCFLKRCNYFSIFEMKRNRGICLELELVYLKRLTSNNKNFRKLLVKIKLEKRKKKTTRQIEVNLT